MTRPGVRSASAEKNFHARRSTVSAGLFDSLDLHEVEPMAIHSKIIGSGFATGEHCVPNSKLCEMMDTSDEWIRQRTGIEQRYVEIGRAHV